jgi:hypothetical protein
MPNDQNPDGADAHAQQPPPIAALTPEMVEKVTRNACSNYSATADWVVAIFPGAVSQHMGVSNLLTYSFGQFVGHIVRSLFGNVCRGQERR